MIYLFKEIIELGLLFSGMSTLWEEINSCSEQVRCYLDIYLTTALSFLYSMIMDHETNAPGHGKMLLMVLIPTK